MMKQICKLTILAVALTSTSIYPNFTKIFSRLFSNKVVAQRTVLQKPAGVDRLYVQCFGALRAESQMIASKCRHHRQRSYDSQRLLWHKKPTK